MLLEKDKKKEIRKINIMNGKTWSKETTKKHLNLQLGRLTTNTA